jgi:riboflavin kinase/FMN adenylyltransferase
MDSSVEGIVVEGDRRGHELGFPTANLRLGSEVDLDDGVYAGIVELENGTKYPAAISVGRRPQYYEAGERLVEAYLLDFEGNLYGEKIRVVIAKRVREQRSYANERELVEQMANDVAAVRALQD